MRDAKWIILIISGLLISALLILTFSRKGMIKKEKVMLVEYRTVHYTDEIAEIDSNQVAPLIYDCRIDFENLPSDFRKKKFIELLLPGILVVKYELFKENARASHIWIRMKNNLPISHKDSLFVLRLCEKYQTNNLFEIIQKEQVHPSSIIIAQAALESGWGTSRLFIESNNLFGIWSYNSSDPRINSIYTRDGKSVFLKKYRTLKECIEDYFLIIANSWAYSDFRQKRLDIDDPFELMWYLSKYSETRYDYVKKIGEIMVQNDLKKFDNYSLSDKYMMELNVK